MGAVVPRLRFGIGVERPKCWRIERPSWQLGGVGKGSVVHECLVWCVKDRGKLDVWMKRVSLPVLCRLSIGSLRNGGSKF